MHNALTAMMQLQDTMPVAVAIALAAHALPLFCNSSEQGRCKDLLIKQNIEDNTKATSDDRLSSSIIVCSDSVHCTWQVV